MYEEYDNFFARDAWERVPIRKVMRILGTKNVYKKKLNAITKAIRFKVRTVVQGYNMTQGVHYEETFAPTPTNQTIRTVLAVSLYMYKMMLKSGTKKDPWMIAESIDIQAAFLESKMDVDVFVHQPPYFEDYCKWKGLKFNPKDVIKLNRAQYGTKDAGYRWIKLFMSLLTNKEGPGMTQSRSDPCLLFKHNSKGELIMMCIVYIDDGILCGLRSEINALKTHIKKRVKITDVGELDSHLGVDYKLCKQNGELYMRCSMMKYIADMCIEFEDDKKIELPNYPTPGKPSTILEKHEGDPVDEPNYRKYVGKVLYAVIKVLPDCANAVRDLTVHLSNPSKECWNALIRLLGYLKHNTQPLMLTTPKELRVMGCFDSDWATDKNDRKSISAYMTTIGGSLVNWQSKKQQTVALSSCEAEITAGSLLAQDVLFENNLLREILGKEPVLPSYVFGDNAGAIFMAKNNNVSQRTKHIDIKSRFLADMTSGTRNEILAQHISTDLNTSDMISKHTKEAIHIQHRDNVVTGNVFHGVNTDIKSLSKEGVTDAQRHAHTESTGDSGHTKQST